MLKLKWRSCSVDLDADETFDGDLFPEDEEMPFAVDDQADDIDNMSEYVPSEPGEDLDPEALRVSPPLRRLKRKTRPPDSTDEGRDINEAPLHQEGAHAARRRETPREGIEMGRDTSRSPCPVQGGRGDTVEGASVL